MNPDLHCPTDRCHNATWADQSWLGGNVPGMNLLNPPVKDTVTVPAGGYVIIRFPADNPGNLPFTFPLSSSLSLICTFLNYLTIVANQVLFR